MPLLFYGRLEDNKRRLYGKGLREIETSTFDRWKIKGLAPFRQDQNMRDLANFWWFEASKHCAISWRESRADIRLPHGIRSNESDRLREQTVFIPSLLGQRDALEILRTEFPKYLIPSPLVLRFNNEREVYLYD